VEIATSETKTNEEHIQELNEMIAKLLDTATKHQEKCIAKRLEKSPENPTRYNVGEYVLWAYPNRPPSKLAPKWRGPYLILEAEAEKNKYVIQHLNTNKIHIAHVESLKGITIGGSTTVDELRTLAALDQDEYVIDHIVEHQFRGRKKRTLANCWFKVRWRDYGPQDDTWQTFKDLQEAEALDIYLAAHPELS